MLSRMRAVTESALQSGALTPLETELTHIPRSVSSPPFQIRLLRKDRKPREKNISSNGDKAPPKKNPFLPYDPALFVEDLPPSHVLLLNKFPVVAHHTLIVTSTFEPQSSLLTHADHTAMWRVLMQFPSLAFYNAGAIAGASQAHKHLQVVRTEIVDDHIGDEKPLNINTDIPFDNLIYTHVKRMTSRPNTTEGVIVVEALPFLHAVVSVDEIVSEADKGNFDKAGELSMQQYLQLMAYLETRVNTAKNTATGNSEEQVEDYDDVKPFSYNFLCTPRWMLVVPRRKECFGQISVNALGFAGFLLVRDEESLSELDRVGGMRVITDVTFKR